MATDLTDTNSITGEQGSDHGKRLLSNYKKGKAFSYFDSQWQVMTMVKSHRNENDSSSAISVAL